MNKKVVVFGGGTGISFLLRGLKKFPVDITAVISVSDDGRSTGKLREEFLMPAMGDVRKVLTNLSDSDDKIKELLEYRFDTYSDLDGHPVGNLMMVAMYNITGSLKKSIKVLSDFLGIEHKVLPLSEDYLTLACETVDGDIILGEDDIHNDTRKFKRLFYRENVNVDPEVISSIMEADLIIFSVGSLFTSIIPHLLAKDVVSAIDKSNARILYTCNAVSQPPETTNYTVGDHILKINSYLGERKIDAVIAANSSLPQDIVDKYISEENKKTLTIDKDYIDSLGCELIESDLLIIEDNYIRHDSLKLSTCIFNYLMR